MHVGTEGSSGLSSDKRMPGRIVTFYSYKGGVGRSMAVANIGFLLARDHGLRVLVVDWDLEAPGLHRYFNMSESDLGNGVIDYLDNYKSLVRSPKREIKAEDLSIKPYLQEIQKFAGGGSLSLLGAGSQQTRARYVEKVRSFDWSDFYSEWNGAQVIEGLRKELLELAEVTLIDSRTGITDVGGVCTVQLPDTVVFVFVFNDQNLAGVAQVAGELDDDNNPALKALRRKPELLFLPCRKELSEIDRLREWESSAAQRFSRFCDTPRIRRAYGDTITYLRKASVPYVPYFAYGEELAAKLEKGVELAEAFEPLIGLLLGEEAAESGARARQNWENTRRRILIISGSLVLLSAVLIGLSFFVARAWSELIISGRMSVIRAALGGTLGAAFYSLTRFELLSKESPWKLTSRHTILNLFVDLFGGCLAGLIVRAGLGTNRYYLISAIAAGLFWRPIWSSTTARISAQTDSKSK